MVLFDSYVGKYLRAIFWFWIFAVNDMEYKSEIQRKN